MPTEPAAPVTIRGQFRRSVHLERDFYGGAAFDGYVVTAKARELLGRVTEALEAPVAQRAWSVTGPYGGGKSAFALFLAHLLRGDEGAAARLAAADAALAERLETARAGAFCPVLLVGAREPLAPALLRALTHGLDAFIASYGRSRGRPSEALRTFRRSLRRLANEAREALDDGAPDEARVLDLTERAARTVHATTGGGLFLVVDELGKMLEYAALYPERTDLFVLQRLAERAARTGQGEGGEAPLLLFTILHQAFERYAGRLGSVQRDEWRKVQGRFEDVAFVEPVAETLHLLAEAVEVRDPARLPANAAALVDAVTAAASFPSHVDTEAVGAHLAGALPLHPAVALLVGPLFRRLAQNERSLFAFLASNEPHGFLDVVGREAPPETTGDLFGEAPPLPIYRLDHLYDYLVANLGATLFSERMEKLWAETEAALGALEDPSPLALRLVKHVALLGFAGRLAGLQPTAATLAATADAPPETVEATLAELRRARALTYRPFAETYHVWQGSDFDLEAKLREAREHVPLRTPLAELLTRAAPPAPFVARRHSYRTGATRVFEVVYASDHTWRTAIERPHDRADGRVVYVLPEEDTAETVVAALREGLADPLTLAAVPDGVAALREAVRDLACLDWVRDHAPELEGDAAARREVAEQRAALAAEVERRLGTLLVADAEGRNPCTWVYRGEAFRLANERALQQRLSAVCDAVFAHAPEVWNELLNRRKPSSAAVRGLKLLLDAMVQREDQPRLGIEGTPAEYGMYASILQATGMHRPDDDGTWRFTRPDPAERPGCAAVWDALANHLREAAGRPVPIAELYALLSEPPYGVREGLIPVFFFAFTQSVADEIAFYESGSFVRDLSFETLERLLKSQEKGQDTFTVQWVRIDGARADVLATLAPLLGLAASVNKPLPVALRILRSVHGLPPFVRQTASLSDRTLAVREALQRATDPTRLVFEDLPLACDAGSFLSDPEPDADRVARYADRLQEALRELGGAYDALLTDLQDQLARAFRLRATAPDDRRHELAERARALLPAADDVQLRAFLVRASDEILDTRAWTESVAALLAKQPPTQWSDEDRRRFTLALRAVAQAFDKLEPLALDLAAEEAQRETAHPSDATDAETPAPRDTTPPRASRVRRVRLLVKALNEDEQDGVIHVHPEDDPLIERLYDRLAGALAGEDAHADAQLAALSRLTAELLHARTHENDALTSPPVASNAAPDA